MKVQKNEVKNRYSWESINFSVMLLRLCSIVGQVYVFLTPYNGLQSNRYGHNAKMQFLQESIEHKLPSIQKVK